MSSAPGRSVPRTWRPTLDLAQRRTRLAAPVRTAAYPWRCGAGKLGADTRSRRRVARPTSLADPNLALDQGLAAGIDPGAPVDFKPD
jgi:hypothetical protein